MTLTTKQRAHLRSLGHHLDPVVMVGKDGVTPALIAALDQALTDHELVKVRLAKSSLDDRHEVADALAAQTGAALAQVLGNTMLIYRPHPDEPTITLPR